MEYKGYMAAVEFDDSSGVFHGRVANCGSDPIAAFEATDAWDLRPKFERSIDEYLARCKEDGVSPKPPIPNCKDVLTSVATADAAAANGLTVDSWVLHALLSALGSGESHSVNEPGWKLERVRVIDTGLLQSRPNGWLDDLGKRWEIIFFLLQPPCVKRIEFEPTSDQRNGLKPVRVARKENHKRWKEVSEGTCKESPRDYLGLVRTF